MGDIKDLEEIKRELGITVTQLSKVLKEIGEKVRFEEGFNDEDPSVRATYSYVIREGNVSRTRWFTLAIHDGELGVWSNIQFSGRPSEWTPLSDIERLRKTMPKFHYYQLIRMIADRLPTFLSHTINYLREIKDTMSEDMKKLAEILELL